MAQGYTNLDNVAAYLGLKDQLTSDQQNWATTLMDSAEALINVSTRRSWDTSTQAYTNEQHDLIRDWFYTKHAPVVGITSLVARSRAVADPGTTLAANVDYELQDASLGFVVLTQGYGAGDKGLAIDQYANTGVSAGPAPQLNPGASEGIPRRYAIISYTARNPVPADISQLCTMIVAHWMRINLHPERHEVEQIRTGDQLQVRYEMRPEGLPPEIREMLRLRTRPGIFA